MSDNNTKKNEQNNNSTKKKCAFNCKITVVVTIFLVSILMLVALKQFSSNPTGIVIGYVNNKKVYDSEILKFLDELYGIPENFDFSAVPADQRATLIKQLYTENAILEEAEKLNIAQNKDVAKMIKQATSKILKEQYLNHISQNSVTREKIEEAYKTHVLSLQGQDEIRARHILVKTESEALSIVSELKRNSFKDIAKAKSLDTYSKENGGDLGYFTKGRMVKEFEEQVFNMKIGNTSSPFKTQYGWHIVKLEDRRKAQIPELDKMYEKLKRDLSFQAINKHVSEIKNGIEVELSDIKPSKTISDTNN